MEKKNKVKEHFKKHKMKYVYGAGLIVVGGVCYYLGGHMNAKQTGGVIDKKVIAKEFNDHSINTNNTYNVLQQVARRGHAGDIWRCVETGEVFGSQTQVAESVGLCRSTFMKRVKDGLDIFGNHYEKVGSFNADENNKSQE